MPPWMRPVRRTTGLGFAALVARSAPAPPPDPPPPPHLPPRPPAAAPAPGATVVAQVINGGLAVHETVFGPRPVQEAWEAAQAATASAPPGPPPAVSGAAGLAGLRIVVRSGERMDVMWTVPAAAAADDGGWFVGCHIPGHWAEGMVVPVRFVGPDGLPLPTPGPASGDTLRTPDQEGGSAASR